MRSLLGAGHKHRQGTVLDHISIYPLYEEEWQPGTTIELWWSCPGRLSDICIVCIFSVSSRVTLMVVQRCTEVHREQRSWMMLVRAGWYYYQLSARVGWMALVLSLEHSLFTLMNTTPTPLQPIAKRAFAYWRCSKAGNHRGYEYTWEQCLSF